MISFHYETEFQLDNEAEIDRWLSLVIGSESKEKGDLNFIFCDDVYLHELNVKFLAHDTLTDIISFDNILANTLHGDIFISVDRVAENAMIYEVSKEVELRRVMVHGLLHFCGYKDKSSEQQAVMRAKEDEKLAMFHVEQP